MGLHDAADRLRRIRSFRVREWMDRSVARDMKLIGKQLERAERGTASVAEAWCELCPAQIVDKTAIEGVSRGVLHIRVRDASTRFELDRALRSGMERELVRRAAMSIRRVKLSIGSPDSEEPRSTAP